MKKLLIAVLALCIMFMCAACTDNTANNSRLPDGQSQITTERSEQEKTDDAEPPKEEEKPSEQPVEDEKEITVMYLYINDNKLKVTLAKNKAVTALINILKQGDIAYTASDYGGFEKVGSLGHSLPTENSQITTKAGDVILYSGNQIVLFYGSNTWSYTRLGRINDYSTAELRTLLGAGSGSVQVRISLK